MTRPVIDALPLLGGHPVLDFVNTVDNRVTPTAEADALQSYQDLLAWSLLAGVLTEAEAAPLRERARIIPARAHTALLRAKLLREPLYRLFAHPRAPRDADLAIVESEHQAAMSARFVGRSAAGLGWRWREHDPDTITHRLALGAAAMLTSASPSLVRTCTGDECAWLFTARAGLGKAARCSGKRCRKDEETPSLSKRRSKTAHAAKVIPVA